MSNNIVPGVMAAIAAVSIATAADAFSVRHDHQLHAGAGTAIYAGTRVLTRSRNRALGACVAAGVGKEALDALGLGTPEVSDIVATAVPCLVLWAIEGASRRGRRGGHRPERYTPEPVPGVEVMRSQASRWNDEIRARYSR